MLTVEELGLGLIRPAFEDLRELKGTLRRTIPSASKSCISSCLVLLIGPLISGKRVRKALEGYWFDASDYSSKDVSKG